MHACWFLWLTETINYYTACLKYALSFSFNQSMTISPVRSICIAGEWQTHLHVNCAEGHLEAYPQLLFKGIGGTEISLGP